MSKDGIIPFVALLTVEGVCVCVRVCVCVTQVRNNQHCKGPVFVACTMY